MHGDTLDKVRPDQHTEVMMGVDESREVPRFELKIPDDLLEQWHELDPVMKVVLREQSIMRQQMEWMLKRCTVGCPAIAHLPTLKQDVEGMKKLRDILTAKWSVVAFLGASVCVPLLLLWLGAVISRHMKP